MLGGVFYREFTKFNDFTGVTVLGKVHTHLFLLGMLMFLIVALLDLTKQKSFRAFVCIYNSGVILTAIMMVVRGVTQVLGTSLSKAASASISGIAGIGHILVGVGIILLMVSLKKSAKD